MDIESDDTTVGTSSGVLYLSIYSIEEMSDGSTKIIDEINSMINNMNNKIIPSLKNEWDNMISLQESTITHYDGKTTSTASENMFSTENGYLNDFIYSMNNFAINESSYFLTKISLYNDSNSNINNQINYEYKMINYFWDAILSELDIDFSNLLVKCDNYFNIFIDDMLIKWFDDSFDF